MQHKKLEGSYVILTGDDEPLEYGIVKEMRDVPGYYEVHWFDYDGVSAPFNEYEFYHSGRGNEYSERWPVVLDGNATEQQRFAFKLKHGI